MSNPEYVKVKASTMLHVQTLLKLCESFAELAAGFSDEQMQRLDRMGSDPKFIRVWMDFNTEANKIGFLTFEMSADLQEELAERLQSNPSE